MSCATDVAGAAAQDIATTGLSSQGLASCEKMLCSDKGGGGLGLHQWSRGGGWGRALLFKLFQAEQQGGGRFSMLTPHAQKNPTGEI